MMSENHVIEVFCNFISESFLFFVITLPSWVTIGMMLL